MMSQTGCSPSAEEPFGCLNSVNSAKKKKSKNKKRFSDDQVRSLESMFESETRLEPRKKVQLARELGLQPRQVAIWFQNKRARWKSKQLERDYDLLRANYNSLASRFEALKREKQALAIQLQKLNDLAQGSGEENRSFSEGQSVDSTEGRSENGDTLKSQSEVKLCENGMGIPQTGDCNLKTEYLNLEEPQLLSVEEHPHASLTSPENWGSLDSDGLFGQPNGGCQWWDFWS